MMQMKSIRAQTTTLLASMVAVALLVLGGCGGEEDPCADVDCDFGNCDSQSGECANPAECDEDVDCLPGYECEENACEAMTECSSDEDCEAGVCEDEVCVNPESCEENEDCLERTFCGPDDTCEPDPCNEVECARGTCDRGTDNCVSADECTVENELNDCAVGERCADGECADSDDFCDALECERGECSFQEGGCVDADECESNDECLEGNYCNENGRCQTDLCEANDVECDEGVCDPTSGLCENADECDSDEDCLDDHVCLDESCQLEASACGDDKGDGGCPANQVCEIDGGEAECAEPDECETSFDCLDDRQCLGQECGEPIACEDDRFEPNDDADEATQFFDVAVEQTIEGSICEDDTDVFAFDSSEFEQQTDLARLIVEVDIPDRDQGLGTLELEVTDPSGNVHTESSGSMGANGSVRFEQWVGQVDHGDYLVELSGGDDFNEAGVGYEMSVNLLPEDSFGACDDPDEFEIGRRITGDTDDADSTAVGSSCTGSDDVQTNDMVYEFEVDQPREVTFDLQPQLSDTDFAMSVREECAEARSEMGCVDSTVAEGEDQLSALLGEGTYSLIIQEASPGSGGPFTLESDWVRTECSRADDHCEDADVASVCTADGGRFRSVDCDQGCDPSTGRCRPPEGNSCEDLWTLEPDAPDEATTIEETLELEQMSDAFRLDEDSCIDDPARSQGPDQVFEVELPAQMAMTTEVAFQNGVEGSIYILEDCADASGSCTEGVAGSGDASTNEELTISNDRAGGSQTLYLVVDTAAYQTVTTAEMKVNFEPFICEPNEPECLSDSESAYCNEHGIDYEDHEECDYGCNVGLCRNGNTCDRALPAEDGVSYTGDMHDGDTTRHFQIDGGENVGSCSFSSFDNNESGDHFYRFDLEEDDVYTVDLSANNSSSYNVYWLDECGSLDECDSIEGGVDLNDNQYQYRADEDQTRYLVVNGEDDLPDHSTYDVDFSIEQAECDPDSDGSTCIDSDTADVCAEPGFWEEESCRLGCDNDECIDSNTCSSAYDATSDAQNGVTYSGDLTDFSNDNTEVGCGLDGWYSDGSDAMFRVDLEDGETLSAEHTIDGFIFPSVMIVSDCSDPAGTCLAGDSDDSQEAASAEYTADGDETVYVIADGDWPASEGDTFDLDLSIE